MRKVSSGRCRGHRLELSTFAEVFCGLTLIFQNSTFDMSCLSKFTAHLTFTSFIPRTTGRHNLRKTYASFLLLILCVSMLFVLSCRGAVGPMKATITSILHLNRTLHQIKHLLQLSPRTVSSTSVVRKSMLARAEPWNCQVNSRES